MLAGRRRQRKNPTPLVTGWGWSYNTLGTEKPGSVPYFGLISAYHGIIVALPMPKTKKPTQPFLLAMYEGLEAGFDIAANTPIFGELPRNKQMLVNAWIELHKEELMANWHAGRLSGEFFKLDPLR